MKISMKKIKNIYILNLMLCEKVNLPFSTIGNKKID
jgi:hypothetical protein